MTANVPAIILGIKILLPEGVRPPKNRLIFAGSEVNSVGTHSVGTVRAASNCNLSCMFIPRGSGFTNYAIDGCRLA